jgi:DnaJ-class molecular chaperone
MNRQAEEEIRRERGRAPGGGGGPRVRGVRTSGGDARGDAGTARRFGFDPEQLAEAALMGDLAAADDVGVHEEAEETRRDARGAGRRREPPRPRQGESYRISVQVPFLLAIHGGNYPTQYRIPDAEGRWAMEELELHVPGGLEDGGQIRLPGRGHWGSDGGGRGDLLVDVTVGEHRFFRRDGSDIVVDLPLSPWEAVQGCKLDVPTVYGRATVLVPPGIRSGQRIRIRNLGLLDGGTGRRGNQVLVAQIQTPRDLRPEHVEMLRRIDADLSFDPREGFWIED